MKAFIVLCCFVAVSIATPTNLELRSKWNQFKLAHGKTYQSLSEEKKRIEIFAENVEKIEQHNKLYEQGLVTYKMAINKFADWSQQEFVAYLTKYQRVKTQSSATYQKPLNSDLPSSVDWRNNGSVTGVKDQGDCGACWAFSTTGSLEGQGAIIKGELVSLSEQELIDCSTDNEGCNGGLMDYAFIYVRDNGLTTEAEYPYEGVDGTCRRGNKTEATRTIGYVDIASGQESTLEAAVALVGPVSVAVDASYWSFYSEGIYSGSCNSDIYSLNHGVLAVGYGTDSSGNAYWIIKNSWGESWGESGYIRILRNENACGVATEASYPLLSS